MELEAYVRMLRQRWVAIIALTLIGLAAAAGYTFLQRPVFQAKSQLFVTVTADASATDVSAGNAFAEKRVTSYVSLATSPKVLESVAQELGLSGGAQALASKVTATTPASTVLIEITASDSDPQQAARIANSSAKQLITAVNGVEDVSIVRLNIFEEAVSPTKPVSPNIPLNLVLGMLCGLLAGVGYAYLRQKLDAGVRSQSDIERIVHAGVLGTFPAEPSADMAPVVTAGGNFSHRAESFRNLRTRLQFSNRDGGLQTVVVSSSIPREGKTSTAANLAIVLAETATSVLLVDADLRRPGIASFLGIDGSVGLSDVLSETVPLKEAVQQWGPTGDLHVLPSGSPVSNPSELLGSSGMEKLIARFEADYEMVVIDSPPLLPVTDPAVLGSMAGGVILVVSADGRTTRDDLAQAVSNLQAVEARLLGVVVNKARKSGRKHSYYDYYSLAAEPGKRGLPKTKRRFLRGK